MLLLLLLGFIILSLIRLELAGDWGTIGGYILFPGEGIVEFGEPRNIGGAGDGTDGCCPGGIEVLLVVLVGVPVGIGGVFIKNDGLNSAADILKENGFAFGFKDLLAAGAAVVVVVEVAVLVAVAAGKRITCGQYYS